MPLPTFPSDEPERDEREHRDPADIIRDIIGHVSQPLSVRGPSVNT